MRLALTCLALAAAFLGLMPSRASAVTVLTNGQSVSLQTVLDTPDRQVQIGLALFTFSTYSSAAIPASSVSVVGFVSANPENGCGFDLTGGFGDVPDDSQISDMQFTLTEVVSPTALAGTPGLRLSGQFIAFNGAATGNGSYARVDAQYFDNGAQPGMDLLGSMQVWVFGSGSPPGQAQDSRTFPANSSRSVFLSPQFFAVGASDIASASFIRHTVSFTTVSAGVCCVQNGACTINFSNQCPAGSPWSAGGSCTPSPCMGRCCVPSTGTCSITLQTGCATPNTWHQAGTCSPNTCPQPRYYVGPNGSLWSLAANWSATSSGAGGAGVPVNTNNVFILAPVDKFVVFDATYATPGLNSLTIDGTAGARVSLAHGASAMHVAGHESIGALGPGSRATYTQNGGTHTIGGTLTIGFPGDPAGNGVFDLLAGTLTAGSIVNNGTLTIHSSATIGATGSISGNPVTYTGGVTVTGGTIAAPITTTTNTVITKSTPSPLTISGAQTYATGTQFNALAGTTTFQSSIGDAPGANLLLHIDESTVRFAVSGGSPASRQSWAAAVNVGSLGQSIIDPGNGGQVLITRALSIDSANGGVVDIGDNTLILAHTDLDHGAARTAYLTAKVRMGRGGGEWTGTGILSSIAAANNARAVGVLNNDDTSNGGAGNPIYTVFQGVPVTAQAVLVQHTWYGDSNCDNVLDAADFNAWTRGFVSAGTANPLTGWVHGDSNYDTVVDLNDLRLLARAWDRSGGGLASLHALIDANPLLSPAQRMSARTVACSGRCTADFNCSGDLSVLEDIFDFLAAWLAGDPAADIDGDGLAPSDIFAFLNAWFAGC